MQPELSRFRRALLTDDYYLFDDWRTSAVEQLPELEELEGELMKYEIFLLAALLFGMREVIELRKEVDTYKNLLENKFPQVK